MSNSPHQPSPRPTLEDLLRFKRAERPSPEFWADFDRGLRQKQLAALMNRPRGWSRVRPYVFRGLRWAVPATAAAAVALVVLRLPHNSSTAQDSTVVVVPAPALPAAEYAVALSTKVVAEALPEERSGAEAPARVVLAAAQPQSQPEPSPVPVPVETALRWSSDTLAYSNQGLADYRLASLSPVRRGARESQRTTSSWTSRFSELVRDLSAEHSEARVLQLASMDLSASNRFAVAPAPAGAQLVAGNGRSVRALTDREFRDLDSRLGAKGASAFVIRF